mmetsp:Transcript_19260/g.21823  ORF Transcript_19260/g.21823 Transcript_19260/m.21823 type:complete len:97 (-) Transcript_19260:157-447(-)
MLMRIRNDHTKVIEDMHLERSKTLTMRKEGSYSSELAKFASRLGERDKPRYKNKEIGYQIKTTNIKYLTTRSNKEKGQLKRENNFEISLFVFSAGS